MVISRPGGRGMSSGKEARIISIFFRGAIGLGTTGMLEKQLPFDFPELLHSSL